MHGAHLLAFVIISLATRAESRRVSNTTCGVSAAFYKVADNSALDTNPFLESFVTSMMGCVDLCIETHPCRAFLLRKVNNKKYHCHLLQHDHMSEGVKIISKDGWMLFDTGSEDTNREIGPYCQSLKNNPCPIGCSCIDECDSYRCDCINPSIFKSCQLAIESLNASTHSWIKHDAMTNAVRVRCIKQISGTYIALLDHDSEDRTEVHGLEAVASYRRPIKYGVLSDVIAFVDSSASCKQHIKIESRGMKLSTHGYLVDRTGTQLSGFGVPKDKSGCQCGLTKSCSVSSLKCNCDKNDSSYQADQGYIPDKESLPITEIRLGDTGTEYGYHTLGKVECIEN